MNITPVNNNNVSMHGLPSGWRNLKNRISQKILDVMPEYTQKESTRLLENWKNIDEVISHPAWNRAILGATAIFSQPVIDRYNPRVDDETRVVSMNRTIAKVAVGTTVGIVVRDLVYRLTKGMTNINGKTRTSKFLLPKRHLTEIAQNEKFLKNYRSALAMSIALLVMCVTNFAIDAPLTVFFTNLFNEKHNDKKKKAKESENQGKEVNNV